MSPVIEVRQLHKRYGDTVAVDDISFEVQPGEIFGILGPNGAGKTTTVECIEGLRNPDRGTVSVLGLDPGQRPRRADPAPRRAAPGQPAAGQAAGRRGPRPVQLVLPEPGRLAVADRPARAGRQDDDQVRQAVRGPEAAAVDRAGAGRHPANRHHGRAHHRPGPGRPARNLGADRGRARPGGHDRPGHPLHGRGRTPLRPRGPDRLGPSRGHRHPGQPGRTGSRPSSGSSSARRCLSRTTCWRACPMSPASSTGAMSWWSRATATR